MRIIHVIPLSRGIFRDSLTYFTTEDLNLGALVSIPVRNKSVPALVIGSEPVPEVKSALRQADYSVKKIKNVRTRGLVRPEFITAAIQTANYFGYPVGPVLRSLIPTIILESGGSLDQGEIKGAPPLPNYPFNGNIQALQDCDEERVSYYKGLIRENFAQNGSVVLCVPSIQDLEPILKQLGRGISEYTFVFNRSLTKKELLARWQKAISLSHPVLIVTTPAFLSLPRVDIRLIIIDREQADNYKQLARPFIDLRIFAEFLSRTYQAKLILSDSSLRMETLHRAEIKEILAANPLKQRSTSQATPLLIRGKKSNAINEELNELLEKALTNNEHTVLVANRRGLAPLVVCNDCGTPVTCHRCESPVALHRQSENDDESNFFLCQRCGRHRSAKETCTNCNSWRLKELGTGTEKVVDEMKVLLPQAVVFRLDSDSAKSAKQAEDIITKYLATPGAILVATEMALFYLKEKVENIFVIAIDSTLALPDFRTHERLFNLLLRFRSLATKNFVIQTRYETESLFDHVLKGNIIGFYREEIANRQSFGYPPFKTLIKISRDGNREIVRSDMKKLERLLKNYDPAIYPSLSGIGGTATRLNALIKLNRSSWPDETLVEVLKQLPPSYLVNVAPTDIL